jgi:hypothetical protein
MAGGRPVPQILRGRDGNPCCYRLGYMLVSRGEIEATGLQEAKVWLIQLCNQHFTELEQKNF